MPYVNGRPWRAPALVSVAVLLMTGCGAPDASRDAAILHRFDQQDRALAALGEKIDRHLASVQREPARAPVPIRAVLTQHDWRWGSMQTHLFQFTEQGAMLNVTDGIPGTWSTADQQIATFSSAGHNGTMRWLQDLRLLLVDQINPDGSRTFFVAVPITIHPNANQL